jgi:RNA polymerase sigma-70 factor, ECF subfamily
LAQRTPAPSRDRPLRPGSPPEDGGPPDAEAVARARRGDHEAFRVLVERYQGRAYALAVRVLRDPERARDAVQEAFLKAYAALDRFEGRSGFYTWLYRLVYNLCIDLLRRDRTGGQVEWDEEVARGVAAGADLGAVGAGSELADPARACHRAELREALARAIESLPEAARRTLLLREVDGSSYEEIARVLGVPKGTVMSRLFYARRRVREELIRSGAVEGGPDEPGDPEQGGAR